MRDRFGCLRYTYWPMELRREGVVDSWIEIMYGLPYRLRTQSGLYSELDCALQCLEGVVQYTYVMLKPLLLATSCVLCDGVSVSPATAFPVVNTQRSYDRRQGFKGSGTEAYFQMPGSLRLVHNSNKALMKHLNARNGLLFSFLSDCRSECVCDEIAVDDGSAIPTRTVVLIDRRDPVIVKTEQTSV